LMTDYEDVCVYRLYKTKLLSPSYPFFNDLKSDLTVC
jgi:hypothetical protein